MPFFPGSDMYVCTEEITLAQGRIKRSRGPGQIRVRGPLINQERRKQLISFGPAGCGGLGFKSRVGQIGRSVANDSPPLRRFFEAVLSRR